MKARITIAALATGVAVWGAAPAAADDSAFLRPLQDRFTFLSAEQLLSEGHRVCQALERGTTSSAATTMVQKDLGVSVAVAVNIVSSAAVALC
jgi:Protein of unknown function (DUF732)